MALSTAKIRSAKGFTIVELLIVIVVIGTLAAIVIVAYNGITTRARNTARVDEMEAWVHLFESYRAINGSLPTLATGQYCLGTGFPMGPNGGGVPRCRDYDCTGATCYPESTGTALATTLSSVGRIPSSPKIAVNGTVGPYLDYDSSWGVAFWVGSMAVRTTALNQHCILGMTGRDVLDAISL
jgi:prepilin-type N-terminal cleavage/methylation domain-containing protein